MRTVKDVSALTGISIRTLRYYDEIDKIVNKFGSMEEYKVWYLDNKNSVYRKGYVDYIENNL